MPINEDPVYKAAITFSCLAHELIAKLPEQESVLAEQLSLASIQLPARIAESTLEELEEDERAEIRSSAHGAAARCEVVLSILSRHELAKPDALSWARSMLMELVGMVPR
jgi:four helix bundle protein